MTRPPTSTFISPSPALIQLARLKQLSLQIEYEQNREPYLQKRRAQDRIEYAATRAAEGHPPVRSYRFHIHAEPAFGTEDYEDRDRRMSRDRQRVYRGVTNSTVRPYEDLSGLTPTERAERSRTKATERQRARRAAAKLLPPAT